MRLGAVILAAGAGTRLGGRAKALLRHGDETYLARIARIAATAGARDLVVVVGSPHAPEVSRVARELGISIVANEHPDRGMASSIAAGFAALQRSPAEAAWLWPVDHPSVQPATLDLIIGALGTHEAAQPRYGDRGGHPPLIGRALWPRLASCGDLEAGARGVLRAADVVQVAVDDVGVVLDVDTPGDLLEVG